MSDDLQSSPPAPPEPSRQGPMLALLIACLLIVVALAFSLNMILRGMAAAFATFPPERPWTVSATGRGTTPVTLPATGTPAAPEQARSRTTATPIDVTMPPITRR